MDTENQLSSQGNWLFRWRSYVPLFLLPVLVLAAPQSTYPFNVRTFDHFWELFCFAVSLFGLLFRAYAIGCTPKNTSGRNTRTQVAESLNTTGLYSILRNPLYFGNFFAGLGVFMFFGVWWASLIYIMYFFIYYERIIMAEESFLKGKFGDEFSRYCQRTPAIIPDISQWKAPALPFSLRNVLKREYAGFFAVITAFTFLEMMEDYADNDSLHLDPIWFPIFICGLTIYLVLRTLKKKTRLLHVEGR